MGMAETRRNIVTDVADQMPQLTAKPPTVFFRKRQGNMQVIH